MQKYQSIITATNGSVIRNVPVTVLKEDGGLAEIFLDREGQVPASNPLATDSRGVFYFYAVNGRYSLRTSVDGITITDADAVLLNDPQELATAGPIADAVLRAETAAQRAEDAVEASGIPEIVAAAQNAVVDANNAVGQAQAAASLADTAKNESAAAKVAAENAQSGAQSASAQAGQARADAQTAAQAAAQSAASIDPAYLRNRANHTGTQAISTVTGLQAALDAKETPFGALTQMRGFGIGIDGGSPILPDLDGATAKSGFYRATAASTVGVRPDGVDTGPAVVDIKRYAATSFVQTYTLAAAERPSVYVRALTSAGLGAWRQFAFTSYATTTAAAANTVMDTDGNLQRSTSSAKYKTEVEPVDAALMQRVIDETNPIWYRSLCLVDPADFSYWGLLAEELGAIDPRFVHWARPLKTVERQEQVEDQVETGEVNEAGQPIFRTEMRSQTITEQVPDTDAPLQAEGVMYERLVVPLLWHAKKTQALVDALEQRLAALEVANG